MGDQSLSYKLALEEAKYALKDQLESVQAIKDTAKTVLGSTSIIVAIVASLQSIRVTQPQNALFYNGLVLFAAAAFAALIIMCVSVILPIELKSPIKSSWEQYDKHLLQNPEDKAILVLIAAYIDVVELNKQPISKLAQRAVWSGWLMVAVVVFMLLLLLA